MNKEQAVSYLRFSGFSDEQIKAIEGAFTCDKCVYSTSEGCQYDDITETIPPFEDCISRQAVIDVTWEEPSYTDALNVLTEVRDKVKALPPVNPQKPICPSAGVDCEDCPAYEDAISRKAVLDTLENMDKALDEDRTVENYKELLRECYKVLPSVKPRSEWEHDHEILKAYSDGASAVLESIKYLIEQYEHYLELLDADMKDGSATIVTKTKYAVYTEVVEQLKEVEVQE